MAATKTLSILELLLAMAIKSPRIAEITANAEAMAALSNTDKLSIGSVLEQNAITYKDKTAILYEDSTYTHFEYNALVNQYANCFYEHGIRKGTVAVVFLENRLETLLLISALAKLGAVASMINANQKGAVLKHSIETDQGDYFIIGEERIADFEAILSNNLTFKISPKG